MDFDPTDLFEQADLPGEVWDAEEQFFFHEDEDYFLPEQAEDAHLESAYEDRYGYEDYEPSPYAGDYSEM